MLIKYFAQAEPGKSRIPPALQKEQFWVLVLVHRFIFYLYFFLKVCFHLLNTFINVFRAFGGVRLSLFSTLFLLFFLAKRLKGGDSKNKFLVFFLF